MEVTIFKDIILNTVLVTFPILIYLVLAIYNDEVSENYNNLLLGISLVTSLYFCLRFGITTSNNKIFLFCNIPIVISYIKKKHYLALIMSILNIIYFYKIDNMLFIITIIKYTSYAVLYFIASKRKISTNNFILCTAVLQGFFLSFEYFFLESHSTINDIVILLILVFIYYFITFFIVYIFKIIDKIRNLNNTIKLLEKDKKIKDALFKLTHEIKNPLAVCKGYLEMIDMNKTQKAEKYIKIMTEEINRSLNIMNDFIQFNKIKINPQKICVNNLLQDVYNAFNLVAKTKSIKLTCQCTNEKAYINGDYERLKQALINLIKNSIESINKKGNINMILVTNYNYVEIIIQDNGTGMSQETLSKMKEMFYTTKECGTGLGVALSNEIVEAHKGKLIYNSKLNAGTIAKIWLPK